ncbi:MAG: DUF6057 family protein [Bacteroidales bacterium]|nr:DUF6057 family protein [Bacteroidales bacterium]
MKRINENSIGWITAGLAFLSSYAFFQFAYPYHLMRREQLNLFLYDGQYISETYDEVGGLAHFLGDFVDQFLYFPVVGPVLIALLLTAVGIVVYRLCRLVLNRKFALPIAALVFSWSFMRETSTQYLTQYTVATLGYLALLLAGLSIKPEWKRWGAVCVFFAFAVLSLGKPFHPQYGPLWSTPSIMIEKVMALDVNVSRGNWKKAYRLSRENLHNNEASYLSNLADAAAGRLGDEIFSRTQDYTNSLFLWVSDQVSQFTNGMAGEAWYNLGDMTLAEQSAIVSLQFSPKHTGARYITRLAQVTLINGEYGAAQKYLTMLSKTLTYRRWAISMMPENHDQKSLQWLADARKNITHGDIVYGRNDFRPVLKGLLEANPDNSLARQYLLCYDLLLFELDDFMADYMEMPIEGRAYEEGALIWLSIRGQVDDAHTRQLGISEQSVRRLAGFYQDPERYRNTYWYYYMSEMQK